MTHIIFMLASFMVAPLSAQSTAFPASIITGNPTSCDFQLVTNNHQAAILIDDQDDPLVRLCAGLFRDDVERVTGYKPLLITNSTNALSYCLIIGSMEKSKIIKKLISGRKIDVSGVKGEWESCLTQTVDNPLPGIGKALVIAGSDRRGSAYGVFELSKQIGVSPWYDFADVHPVKRAEISVIAGKQILRSPSVKYRGIFINDEMWGLRSVMENLMTLQTELNIDKKGEHILKIWMVDPGVVIDKLIVNTGGIKKSYLGPPESFSNRR
jgi:hypothetical protein